jgi:hypothetical protein
MESKIGARSLRRVPADDPVNSLEPTPAISARAAYGNHDAKESRQKVANSSHPSRALEYDNQPIPNGPTKAWAQPGADLDSATMT